MNSLIDYIFGTGDGSTTTWTSRADLDLSGDGVADAVRLDFDGDGLRDDAMWDTDGDGVADLVAIDIDSPDTDPPDSGTHDPAPERFHSGRFYSDSGKGLWDVRESDPSKVGTRNPPENTKPENTKPESTKPESTGPDDTKPGSAESGGHQPRPDPDSGKPDPGGKPGNPQTGR
ncbi:MAG: hypothetical protein WAV90_23230, partial [Gordonia amarae]